MSAAQQQQLAFDQVDVGMVGGDDAVGGDVDVRRSTRRRRTVTAYRSDGRTVVLIPARFSAAEERRWVADMLARLAVREQRATRGARGSDPALVARSRLLADRHLDGRARPASVRWVENMTTRWASCTPADDAIRVSTRMREMPDWVLDYVLVHELAHLLEAGHGERFWRLVERYPRTERARGYLEGVAAAAGWDPAAEDDVLAEPA
ncbi:MAG: M48 metallopeptidase family protein [Mycobacteriales bacterium]